MVVAIKRPQKGEGGSGKRILVILAKALEPKWNDNLEDFQKEKTSFQKQ